MAPLLILAALGVQQVNIQSATLVVKAAEHRAIFGGGVTAVRGDLTLTCPEAVALYGADTKVTTVTCQGPVHATQGARTLTAAAGVFDNVSGELTLTGQPTFVEGERKLSGENMVYTVASREALLTPARAQLPAADAGPESKAAGRGPLTITSEHLRWEDAPRRATFIGDVVATRGDLVLHTDKLTATEDAEGKLEEAHSSGPVTVDQGDRHAHARSARFTGGARLLVLEGDPVVTEKDSTVTGDRATFRMAEDKVEVEHPKAIFPLKEAARP